MTGLMNTLDWVILVILFIGFLTGFFKGVIQQAFSLGGLILGIICGTLLYKPFAGLLLGFLNMNEKTAQIVAFIIILLVVPIVCGLLGKVLSKLVHAASLGFIDRILGAAFGILKYILIMGLVIKLMDITGLTESIIDSKERKESRLYEPVCGFTGFCLQWTWNKIQETAEDMIPVIPDKEGHDRTDTKKI